MPQLQKFKEEKIEALKELIATYRNSNVSTNYAVNVMRRKPNSILEQEIIEAFSSALDAYHEEVMKYIPRECHCKTKLCIWNICRAEFLSRLNEK